MGVPVEPPPERPGTADAVMDARNLKDRVPTRERL